MKSLTDRLKAVLKFDKAAFMKRYQNHTFGSMACTAQEERNRTKEVEDALIEIITQFELVVFNNPTGRNVGILKQLEAALEKAEGK